MIVPSLRVVGRSAFVCTLGAFFVGLFATAAYASTYMTFFRNGDEVVCSAQVEASPIYYVTVDVRIYHPNGSLLAHAAAVDYVDGYVARTIWADITDPGDYRCVAYFSGGPGDSGSDEQYVHVD